MTKVADTVAQPQPQPRARSVVGGRAGWGLADQAVSSLTNAGLSIIIARSVDAASFGAFGIAFAVFSFALGSSRALATDPLVIRYSAAGTEDFRRAVGGATGLALALGLAAGTAVLAAGAAVGGTVGGALSTLAVVLPGLLLQDAWRHAFLAARRPRNALVNDLCWGAVQFVAIGLLVRAGTPSASMLVLGWGGAALVAAGLGLAQMRVLPRPERAGAWLREHRDLGPLLVLEYAITMGAFNAALLLIGLLGGLAEVGAIRAAQVLLGPLQMLFLGVTAITVPEFSRRLDRPPRTLARYAAFVSGTLGAAGTACLVVLLLLPERLGREVLGDTWAGARSALPYIGVMMICVGLQAGPYLMLRALAAGRHVLKVSALQAPLTLVLGIVGAVTAGAAGAAGGFAVAHVVGTGLWWRNLRARLHGRGGADDVS